MHSRDKYKDIFSKKLRAGNRNYYFDVKQTIHNDYYVVITETKPNKEGSALEKHKIFLYKEDFQGFKDMLEIVTQFSEEHNATLEDSSEDLAFQKSGDMGNDVDFIPGDDFNIEEGWDDINTFIEKE